MRYLNIHGGISFNTHIFVIVLTVVLTESSNISQSVIQYQGIVIHKTINDNKSHWW